MDQRKSFILEDRHPPIKYIYSSLVWLANLNELRSNEIVLATVT